MRGRPALASGQKVRKIDIRFTEEEYRQVLDLEKQLGVSKAELLRAGVLKTSKKQVTNARELIGKLDLLGAELGRSGNNINQLARYANILSKKGQHSVQVIERFNVLLSVYIKHQQALEVVIRKMMREMGR